MPKINRPSVPVEILDNTQLTTSRRQPGTRKIHDVLSVPQIRVMLALAKAHGPLTRTKLSNRIGNKTTVVVGRALGYDDPEKRTRFENTKDGGHRPSLQTLGYVKLLVLDIDGLLENAYELTDTGAAMIPELKLLQLPRELRDSHAIHRAKNGQHS